jgi:hypothetical protein
MKIRPKTFKLLKELLLEKGGVFYMNNHVIDFKYSNKDDRFFEVDSGYEFINDEHDVDLWLTYNDWHIKV